MLRWLVRLLIAGLVAAAVAFVLARVLGQDEEDFDDFDEFDTEFEFETPVEIDVPADGGTSTATMGSGAGEADTSGMSARVSGARSAATAPLRSLEGTEGATDMTAQTAAGESGSLIDINGIGPAYEARLQAIGINTMADLANADSNHIAEQIDPIGGINTVEDWISQARAYIEGRWGEGGQG
jgi:predicted flap endonuclease-1-like 5' DNA nuclease